MESGSGRYPRGSRIIRFPSGGYVIVDSYLYPLLSRYYWYQHKSRGGVYARATILGQKVFMHRYLVILEGFETYQVDHLNRNTLDNRIKNLRLVTASENARNKRSVINQ